jgi:hypothetical protein
MATYRGSCHCGRVTFELTGDIDVVFDCNCSVCRRKGALWHSAPEGNVRITGADELALYQFGTNTAKHYFCRHCGVHPVTRPRIDPTNWVVNVRCIDDIDLAKLTVHTFDGQNWEAAAKALLKARRGSS